MVYYLNAFCPIVQTKDAYELPENNLVIPFGEVNLDVLRNLLQYEGIEEEQLKTGLGEELFAKLLEKRILITGRIDEEHMYSRSMSYYYHKSLGNVSALLSQKKVLILGCGGIGSHIAWNLAALGVGTVYLLDCDEVSMSNLNRQIWYDTTDVGKCKVDVLKEKLRKVNPYTDFQTIHCKIESKDMLDQIVREVNPDVIVKSLDSPIYFPKWLDEVCTKYEKKYVSGILSGTAQMIGPTYIPGKSAGYCDFFDVDENKERIAGIGPSLGFVMYQIAGKLTEEIFKLLTEKGELLYQNRIELYENVTNEKRVLIPKHFVDEKPGDHSKLHNIWSLLVIVSMFFAGTQFKIPQYMILVASLIYTVIVPVVISNTKQEVFSYSFINLIYIVLCNMIINISSGIFASIDRTYILGFISLVYTILGIFVLLLGCIEIGLFQLKIKWKQRRS